MNRKQQLIREKICVVGTGAVLLAGVYGLFGPAFEPSDPTRPITLLAGGSAGGVLAFLAVLLGVSAMAGVLTIPARPAGTVLACLVAVAGLIFRSGGVATLLWSFDGASQNIYMLFLLEMVLLAVMLVLAMGVSLALRRIAGRAGGRWVWKDFLVGLSDTQRNALARADLPVEKLHWSASADGSVSLPEQLLLRRFSRSPKASETVSPGGAAWRNLLYAAIMTMGVAGVLVVLIMKSDLRGQVLFALFAAFFLAGWLASAWFSAQSLLLPLLAPLVVGGAFYALGAVSNFPTGPVALAYLQPPFLSTPLDWALAGGAGALAGFWTAGRSRDAHIAEVLDAQA